MLCRDCDITMVRVDGGLECPMCQKFVPTYDDQDEEDEWEYPYDDAADEDGEPVD